MTRPVALPGPDEDAPHWYLCLHVAAEAGARCPREMHYGILYPRKASLLEGLAVLPPLPLAASVCFPCVSPGPPAVLLLKLEVAAWMAQRCLYI